MWLFHGSYGIYMAITGSMWLSRGVLGNLPVTTMQTLELPHRSRNCHDIATVRSISRNNLMASTHYKTQRLYDSASHEQSCKQTPHTTRADCWAPRLAHKHFTICHSKCAIEVHDQSWRFNMSNPHEWTHAWLENLHASDVIACVTMPVAESCDRESWNVWRPLHYSYEMALCKGVTAAMQLHKFPFTSWLRWISTWFGKIIFIFCCTWAVSKFQNK